MLLVLLGFEKQPYPLSVELCDSIQVGGSILNYNNMPTVEVEVDLDDFDTSDIIEYLESTLESKYTRDSERNEILNFCKKSLNISTTNQPTTFSLLDTMKIEPPT